MTGSLITGIAKKAAGFGPVGMKRRKRTKQKIRTAEKASVPGSVFKKSIQ